VSFNKNKKNMNKKGIQAKQLAKVDDYSTHSKSSMHVTVGDITACAVAQSCCISDVC